VTDHGGNVLGALALVVTDRIATAIAAETGLSVSAAAAVSALDQFLDRPSLDRLRQVLGLTPSGTVRLVDRLAQAGLVARGPGGDGRTRSITLTDHGRDVAARVASARSRAVAAPLADLAPAERQAAEDLLGRLVAAMVHTKEGGGWTCRLCDLTACGRAEGRCPAARAAAERYGFSGTPPATH
jgi:DNA-binding MarR family transcriptional regulator